MPRHRGSCPESWHLRTGKWPSPPRPSPGPTEAREAHSLLASWALRGASHPACAPTPGPKPDSASDELHEPGQVIRPPGFGFPTSKMELMTAPEPQDRGDGSVGVRWLSPAAAAAPAPTAGRALGINQPRPARRCHLPPAPVPHPTRASQNVLPLTLRHCERGHPTSTGRDAFSLAQACVPKLGRETTTAA